MPLTIAIRHQLQFRQLIENHSNVYQDFYLGPNNTDETEVCSLKFLEILGKKLSKDSVIITGFNDNGVQFGKIKNIIILNNKVTLQIEVFDKICFNDFFLLMK